MFLLSEPAKSRPNVRFVVCERLGVRSDAGMVQTVKANRAAVQRAGIASIGLSNALAI